MISLAVKYRPKCWADVVEQDEIKEILSNQLMNKDIRNAYLFVGGAGTGKTTSARIFAYDINNGQGKPIEIDGASNNGVDQIREIIQQAKTRAVDGEYKVFIIDECHMITIQGWNAFLKCLEETPLKTIFIFCTTNPEKIPSTILSRVQRYDFKRISTKGILKNLSDICGKEEDIESFDIEALEYIAKLADGHMRDAITMLDKCVAYDNTQITIDSITKALGVSDYSVLTNLLLAITGCEDDIIIRAIERASEEGTDLKMLVDDMITFMLDYAKWKILGEMKYCKCPSYLEELFRNDLSISSDVLNHVMDKMIEISNSIKYVGNPKYLIEAQLLLESDFIRRNREC